jgi:hypothetical protein
MKISIMGAGEAPERQIVKELQSNGVSLTPVEDPITKKNVFLIEVQFNGMKPIGLSVDDLEKVCDTLGRDQLEIVGGTPGDVFSRSARVDGKNLVAKFSDEPRARSVEIPLSQRAEVIEFFDTLAGRMDEFVAMFNANAAKAASEAAKK